jgi:hypothetical protein
MIIAVAGPYSAPTKKERRENLDRLNRAAAELLQRGHIPLIGVNAALPVIESLDAGNRWEAIMKISMAVIANAEALLLIAESRGANMERDYVLGKGLPVYYNIGDVPSAV